MGYRMGCPKCDGWTSDLFKAYEDGEPCPYCGANIHSAANDQHYFDQVAD